AARADDEATWREEVDDADQKVAALTLAAYPDTRELLQAVKKQRLLRNQQLRELDELRRLHKRSRELRDAPQIDIPDLVELLDDVQAVRKRVVLFIDDFQRLLMEPGLTDGLFSFLRAAN